MGSTTPTTRIKFPSALPVVTHRQPLKSPRMSTDPSPLKSCPNYLPVLVLEGICPFETTNSHGGDSGQLDHVIYQSRR